MKKLFLLLLFFLAVPAAQASDEGLMAFKQLKNIDDLDLTVPTVVELPLEDGLVEWPEFSVLEVESNEYQPSFYMRAETKINYQIMKDGSDVSRKLSDNDNSSFVEFDLPEDGNGNASLKIKSNELIKTDTIILRLARYVALPTNVEVKAIVNGQEKIIVAKSRMRETTIHFPQISSREWTINLDFSQPLRITEFDIKQMSNGSQNKESLRFLARPDMTYAVYINPDRHPDINVGESGDLRDNKGVEKLGTYATRQNPLYVRSDFDKDGVVDELDNCVQVANADQKDIDGNLRGDACDDFDRDGIINSKDNCPDKPNLNQRDTDADKIGDVCDTEESRLTEKSPWLVWLGLGLVALVIAGLFIKTLKDK